VSATVLQRVVVRMLFDPAFCQRVYADPATALHGVDLTAEERQWLVTPDPRAYGVDVHRRSRALTGLLEEYPVAGALAVRCPQGVQRLYGFFAAAVFHQCVQQRGSMAEAFGAYLGSEAFVEQPALACLAEIERSIVRVRRALAPAEDQASALAEDSCLCLAPWVALLSVPARTLSCYSDLRQHLLQHGGALLKAVLDPAYHLPGVPPLHDTEAAFVLVVNLPGGEGPSLEPTSQELGALLAAAQQGITCQDLCAVAVNLGAEPHEAPDIIQGLLTDRLLIRCQ
jgi:hypothetical protein